MEKEKVVLITGCSSGFGLWLSKRLCDDKKYIVYSTMRNLEKKDALVKEINKEGGAVNILELDVTKPNTIKKTITHILSKHGRIDVLVNNAGQSIGGFFEDLSNQEIRNQLEPNFFGVQNVIKEVLPSMHSNRSGKIINISSIAGLLGYPGLSAYNASKWALEGFSESLRMELLPFGIKVVLVEPGSFRTKIFEENAQFADNIINEKSKYFPYSKHLIKTRINGKHKLRGNPLRVAKKIEKLIKTTNPPFRNIIGADAVAGYYCKKFLPHKLFEKLVHFAAFRTMHKKSKQ